MGRLKKHAGTIMINQDFFLVAFNDQLKWGFRKTKKLPMHAFLKVAKLENKRKLER